ncbi:MAG: hypothetical protein NTX52_05505 [Planctomycetota bacterium]|nr:hypothetical protein [Planctomycetota bacterium]
MSNSINNTDINRVRWGWLKFMYIYTIVVAGGCGLGMIVVPNIVASTFGLAYQVPVGFGIVGSVYLAFGVSSLLGLRAPLKFVPVLLLQLCYKAIWFVGLVLPLLVKGQFPSYAIPIAIIFATYVIGDLIAIPFPYLLSCTAQKGE